MSNFLERLHGHVRLMMYVVDPLERAGRTFVQQLPVILLATGTGGLLVTQNWVLAVDSAAFAAVVSILTSVLTFPVPKLAAGVDLLLRVAKTYLQSFVGTLVAANVLDISHADWRGALAVGFPTALTSLVMGLAAMKVPGTEGGASLIPLPANPLDADGTLPPAGTEDEVFDDYASQPDEPLGPDEEQPAPGGEMDGHDHRPEHAAD